MYEHFPRYSWVLPTFRYGSLVDLLTSFTEQVISPAEKKVKELLQR
jgi:hypothetical protein